MALAAVQCSASLVNGTGLNLLEAKNNVQLFCQNFDSQTISTGGNLTTTYKPTRGNSDMRMLVTSTCEVKMEKTGCVNTFYKLLDDCPGQGDWKGKEGLGYFGGSVKEGCAEYKIETEVEEQILCGSNPYHHASDIYREAFDRAVKEYCSADLTLTPDFVRPSGFQQTIPNGQSFANVVMEDGLVVKVVTQFNDQGQEGCVASMEVETKGDECRRKLKSLWERCGAPGGVVLENGGNGCVVWSIWGQKVR